MPVSISRHPLGTGRLMGSLCAAISLLLAYTEIQAQTTSAIQGAVVDVQGQAISGARIHLTGPTVIREIEMESDAVGLYRLVGLPAGTYTLRVAKMGFAAKVYTGLTVPVNALLNIDVVLEIGTVHEELTVLANPPPIEAESSSSGAVILPREIEQLPVNGRNYLDLMQLVPGVIINHQVDAGTDAAVPVLGERGGNTMFLIDGMPNSNAVDGGFAAPFDQESILEFQVITSGYKAEFGHGSGGVVNVITRSGTSQWHGQLSGFHRNDVLDASNAPGKTVPFLRRWDMGSRLGGPVLTERAFVFGSLERIRESRQLNFNYPPNTPSFLRERERAFDHPSQTYQTRGFFKVDEVLGRHRITEQISLTNGHLTDFLPLSQAVSLPSTRIALDSRHLMVGFRDTAILGDFSAPWVLSAYGQFRGEPTAKRAAHFDSNPATTLFNMFTDVNTGRLTGDLGQVQFGAAFTPLVLDQRYTSVGAHLEKAVRGHTVKFGGAVQRTRVDGTEAANWLNQLFATPSDFAQYGPIDAGLYVLTRVAGPRPEDETIRLRNSHIGLFMQEDWKVARGLTFNLGLRWDFDSRFPNYANLAPRLGLAWSPAPKMVIRSSWGVFYDHFRLGLARDIPAFGGANLFRNQTISFPRLFYGIPTTLPRLYGLCLSPELTDAQLAGSGMCPVAGLPIMGVDRLNGIVAPGHAPVPPNATVTAANVQALTGLTADQFAERASAAVGRSPGFFFWEGFGNLTMNFPVPRIFSIPITVDPQFRTPHTRAFHLGIQRELMRGIVLEADYHHRQMRNILGVRTTNLAFAARLPGRTGELELGGGLPIQSYGPWYEGVYDGITFALRKRFGKLFSLEGFYTGARATDNALRASLVSDAQTGRGAGFLGSNGPTDSFIGVPPVVTDPLSGLSNATASFVASNGNPVPQAGKFYNGPDLDRGPSDLALDHSGVLHGTTQLPWEMALSGIFRAQSGFHFSAAAAVPIDVDGDGLLNGVDFASGRNRYEAPPYVNLDLRLAKRFTIFEKVRVQVLIEFFNVLNRGNPAAVEQYRNVSTPFGRPLQVLPGREGQWGLRIQF